MYTASSTVEAAKRGLGYDDAKAASWQPSSRLEEIGLHDDPISSYITEVQILAAAAAAAATYYFGME